MSEVKKNICKYNTFGFCKFREYCRKRHENKVCDNQNNCNRECIKRHPKECKTFNKSGKCRFNEDCAYQHVNKVDSNSQSEINQMMTQLMIKHDSEVAHLKAEVEVLKQLVLDMGNHMK